VGIGTFNVGQRFELDGQRHRITRVLDADRIEFEDAVSERRQELTKEVLVSHFKQGRLVFKQVVEKADSARAHMRVLNSALMAAITPSQRKLAVIRLHFVKRLQGVVTTRAVIKPLIEAMYQALSPAEREVMPKVPHASTVTKWMQQYRDADESINALVDRHALKGNRDSRLHPEIDDLVDQCIRDLYLTPERRSKEVVLEAINHHVDLSNQHRIESEYLPRVGICTLKRKIEALDAFDVCVARYGQQHAKVKFRSTGMGERAELPLERASIDHCRLDVFVVDEETGLPLGRPWLTVILDECTRMVLGYSVSFDEPSAMTVMRALRHAMLPKDDIDEITNAWPTWGVIKTLLVDNGLEFHGFSLDHAAGQFGTTVQTCPRRMPWYKGKVERYFRTVHSNLIAEVPGRTFSNILERGDYDSSKHAVISLDTLNLVLNIWTVDYYHQRKHSALGESPAMRWARLVGQVDRHLPESAEFVDAAFGKPDTRVLGHQGVQFDSLFYNSDELAALRHRHGDRFNVKIVTNDEDVGHLYVICPDSGAFIKVQAVDLAYARGLTRWQHRKCREYAAVMGEEKQRNVGLAEAKQRIRELIAADIKLNRRPSRRNQGRFIRGQAPLFSDPPAPKKTKVRRVDTAPAPSAPESTPAPLALSTLPNTSQFIDDDDLIDLTASTANQFNQEARA